MLILPLIFVPLRSKINLLFPVIVNVPPGITNAPPNDLTIKLLEGSAANAAPKVKYGCD